MRRYLSTCRKESVYLNQILPEVIQNGDSALREDFLENSGLDRFYLESLEHEYFEEKNLDIAILDSIRENKDTFWKLEAASGFEPLHKGFADLPLSHLGTPPLKI